VAARLVLMFTY